VWSVVVVALDEVIELALLLRKFLAAGLVASFFNVRCIRSWRPFCCGLPGLMRSMPIPRRSHYTESLVKPKKAPPLAKGMPLSVRIARGSPKSLKTRSNTVNASTALVVANASQQIK
jgi:hypothetical protein